jgi:hypothetical protein
MTNLQQYIDDFTEARSEAERLRNEYYENHKACPKCGRTEHNSTCRGPIMNMSAPEKFKDTNDCICNNCGDKHITHDRVPLSN